MRRLLVGMIAGCTAAHAPVAAPPTETDRWAKLSYEERHTSMTFKTLPNMAKTWQAFNGTKYPELTCRTCHGPDAEEVHYRMPNPTILAIDAAKPPPGPMTDFMVDKVVPEMVSLLETTPSHLGCNSCHPKG